MNLQTKFLVLLCWILCYGCNTCDLPAKSIAERVTIESRLEPARAMASAPSYKAFGILLKTADRALLSIYREGVSHADDKGRIVMKKSQDGSTWSQPRVLFDDPLLDDRNVAGGVLPSGTMVVFWNTYDFVAHRTVAVFQSRSFDNGETWTLPTQIPRRNVAYGPVVILPDSVAMCLANVKGDDVDTYLHFSFDDGETWNVSRRVPASSYETAFIALDENRILGFARNIPESPIVRLYTKNRGVTWKVNDTGLRNDDPASSWELVSPWITRVRESPPQVDLWYAERLDFQQSTERGFLRSILFDAEMAVSHPGCLNAPRTVFAAGSWDFGYPSVALLPRDKFLGQFYSKTQDEPAALFLVSGDYIPKETALR